MNEAPYSQGMSDESLLNMLDQLARQQATHVTLRIQDLQHLLDLLRTSRKKVGQLVDLIETAGDEEMTLEAKEVAE